MTGQPGNSQVTRIASATDREVVIAHASDLHVDHGYTAKLFDGDGAGSLRAVLAAARKISADLVLLAGDTFDCHRLPDALLTHTAATIREFGLPIVLLPGNHDPAIDDAVFHHPDLAAIDGLHILGITHHDAVRLPHLDLEVWGRPHRDYYDMEPIAEARERSTRWQIAMGHGHYLPAHRTMTDAKPSWLFGDEEIEATGADYIALGHWNRQIKVGSGGVPAWYCGSPDYARSINVVRLQPTGCIAVEHAALDLPAGFGADHAIAGGAD